MRSRVSSGSLMQQQHRSALGSCVNALWPIQRVCSRQTRCRARTNSSSTSSSSSSSSGGNARLGDTDLRQLLGQSYLRPEYEPNSDEHVDDLVDAAAGLISVLDDLRPLDAQRFNGFYEIYKAIAAVPPADRVRILDELEPGALVTLWRASVAQYVLDDGRKQELFEGHIIWDDFPKAPGQAISYEGLCEQFRYESSLPTNPADDMRARTRDPRLKPWLRTGPAAMAAPQERFRQQFFVAKRTGLLHSRLLLRAGPLSGFLTPPLYARLEVGLTLTPAASDAGADAALIYPADAALLAQRQAAGVALAAEDLPSDRWPAPSAAPSPSPLSYGERDFLRVAGPGFYVGCAYRCSDAGDLLDQGEHVYFALVRTSYD